MKADLPDGGRARFDSNDISAGHYVTQEGCIAYQSIVGSVVENEKERQIGSTSKFTSKRIVEDTDQKCIHIKQEKSFHHPVLEEESGSGN